MATGEKAPQTVSKEQTAGQAQAAAQWDTLRQVQMGQPGELAVTGAGPTELAASGPTEIVASGAATYEEPEDFGQYQIPQNEEIEAEVLAIEDAPGKAETTWDDVAEMAQKSNKEKKQEWKQAEKKREQKEVRAERKQQERIREGKMPRERRPGEDYGDYMSSLGETEWLGQQEARENYQADKRMLEEWENSGKMPEELYRRYPRKTGHMVENGGRKEMIPGESDAEYKARIEASLKMGLAREFPREVRVFPPAEEGGEPVTRLEHSDEWAARLEEEGMKDPLTKTPEEMRGDDDADIFRELTNNNPQYEDESDADYWGRLCWLREMQKELAAEDAEVQAEDDDFGDDLIDLGISGSDDGGIEVVTEEAEGGAEDEGEGDDVEQGPFAAVNVNIMDTAQKRAHEVAQERVNADVALEGGFFVNLFLNPKGLAKAIWKGNLMKNWYVAKEEQNVMEQIRAKQEGRESDLTDVEWDKVSKDPDRFVQAAMEGIDTLIHEEAGEEINIYGVEKGEDGKEAVYRYVKDENGEEHKEALADDEPLAIATKGRQAAIEGFIRGDYNKETLRMELIRIQSELSGEDAKELMVGNYLEVAEMMKERVDHEESMENVMRGFRMIEGEARLGTRTEEHQSTLDKITDKVLDSRVGRLVPPEALTLAMGMAGSIATTAAKTPMRLIPVVGPALANLVVGTLRERENMNKDRAVIGQRLARGEEIGMTEADRRVAETQYAMQPATDLESSLRQAMESGDQERLIEVVATVDAARDLSDTQKIDLIKYSSGENSVISDERMKLDIALFEARQQLGQDVLRADTYKEALLSANESLQQDIEAKDKIFNTLKSRQSLKQGVKSAVMTVGTALLGQEISGAGDEVLHGEDRLHGLIDIWRGAARGENARDTLLVETGRALGVPGTELNVADFVGLSEAKAKQLEELGYETKAYDVEKTITTTQEVTQTVSPGEYTAKHGTPVHWIFGNNETVGSDIHELEMYDNNDGGFVTGFSHRLGTDAAGNAFNPFNEELTYAWQPAPNADPVILPTIQLADGNVAVDMANLPSGVDLSAGHTMVAAMRGMAEDGRQNLLSIAAVDNGWIDQITETVVEEHTEVVKEVAYDVTGVPGATTFGFSALRRQGVSGPRNEQVPTGDEGEGIVMVDGVGPDGEATAGMGTIDGDGQIHITETLDGLAPDMGNVVQEDMSEVMEEEPKTIDEQIAEYAAGRYGAVEPARMEKYNKDLKDALAEWQQLSEERKQVIREQQGPSRVDGWALYWMYKELCDIGLIK